MPFHTRCVLLRAYVYRMLIGLQSDVLAVSPRAGTLGGWFKKKGKNKMLDDYQIRWFVYKRYGNFDVISAPLLACFSAPYRHTRAVWYAQRSAHAYWMLIGALAIRWCVRCHVCRYSNVISYYANMKNGESITHKGDIDLSSFDVGRGTKSHALAKLYITTVDDSKKGSKVRQLRHRF